MKKIAHLDLKGLPPLPGRLIQLPELYSSLGFDGILVEWEDTFPYASMPEISTKRAYTTDIVRKFLKRAKRYGLTVIPLVQTFGHLESVLVHNKYCHLREHPDDPRDICPSNPESVKLIIKMIGDILSVHREFGISHIHLGADEVWSLGTCPKCKRSVCQEGKPKLFYQHMAPLIEYVHQAGLKTIIWHDMLRGWSDESISLFAQKVEVAFWDYRPSVSEIEMFASSKDIKRFQSIGLDCWGSAAYKGGDRTDKNIADIDRRARNTISWLELGNKHHLLGIILTGWSKYNTLATCCDPLEANWLSLAVCEHVLKTGKYDPVETVKINLKRLFGLSDLNQKVSRKNQNLWNIYLETKKLEDWVETFDVTYLRRPLWHSPQLWGEKNFNCRDRNSLTKAIDKEFKKFPELADNFYKKYKGFASDFDIKNFLKSRIVPRKKLCKWIDKGLSEENYGKIEIKDIVSQV